VGRGVLLDYASWAGEQKSIDLNPFEATQVPLSQLRELIKEQNIAFQPGDVLFIRVGFTAAYNALADNEQKALSERPRADFSGIESSEATLRFLWDNQFAAVAGDAPSFERSPPVGPHADDRFVLHEWLLAGWGMPIGEVFDLEKLSETCKKLGRHSFFVSSMPLKVRQANSFHLLLAWNRNYLENGLTQF
jgi:kynurenine formamidase